ncbi:MAG: hypothetical protein PWQ25_1809 [Deferribacteres bacterium]|nr:crispr-associated protein cas6 [Deferribacteraceae bacterium]MDK2792946.1 hypothetical protein [Deferribacteres bacterium]
MPIPYQKFEIFLEFEKNAFADIYPSFALRAVLGKELKRFACILRHKQTCDDCPLRFQCAYSVVFETPIEKNNDFLKGRDKASHPFITYCERDVNTNFNELKFELTLFGKGIKYFPYIYYGFLKAGENGLFRERAKYRITKVFSGGHLVNDGSSDDINLPEGTLFTADFSEELVDKNIRINFLSPSRLKVKGKYSSEISFSDILIASLSRYEILSNLYGTSEKNGKIQINLSEIESENCLVWKEYKRYSSRQNDSMIFGGVVGYMNLRGKFPIYAISLLKFAEIFGLGKNTGFGFGKILVEELNE